MEFAQLFIDTIHSIESRCMAADGPVTPTCKEITDDELRMLYRAAQSETNPSLALLGTKAKVIERLRACIDDPMWADHAEVSKATLRAAIALL